MSTSQTDLLLNAKTRGFDQAIQKTSQLGKQSKKAMAESKTEVERLEGSLRRLARQQVELNRALEGTHKGSKAYKALSQELKNVQREAHGAASTISALERAYKDALQRRGAFSQGFMQGAMPSAFLQRGPGMMRQAAGVGAGRAVRGMAGGIGSTPFSGASGLVSAVQSIPVVGGALAMPLQQSLEQAQAALAFKHTQMAQTPYLGGIGMLSAASRARGRIRDPKRQAVEGGDLSNFDIAQRIAQARSGRDALKSGGGILGFSGVGMGAAAQASQDTQIPSEISEIIGRRAKADASYNAAKRKADRDRASAVARVRSKYIGDIQSTGLSFGYGAEEATQIAGSISASGGGGGKEMARQGMLQAGMAAQRFAGIGANVSGAFLQGGRSGGVTGGMGRSGDALTEAIKDGMKIGLEGSELSDYMSQMAGDIRSWRSTGISVNPSSIAQMGRGVAATGIGGVRGAAISQSMAGAVRNLSSRAPQNAAELAVYEEIGGFKREGGAESLEEAQINLEKGNVTKEQMMRLVKRLSAGGSEVNGRGQARALLANMGITVGAQEMRMLTGTGMGAEESEKQKAAMLALKDGAGNASRFDPSRLPRDMDPAIVREASLGNRRIANGGTMIGTMQNLESSMLSMSKGFTNLAAEPLMKLTSGISELSGEIPKLTEKIKSFVTSDTFGVLPGGGD